MKPMRAAVARPSQTEMLGTARQRRRLATGLVFIFWTLMGLLHAGQLYLGDGHEENTFALWRLAV